MFNKLKKQLKSFSVFFILTLVASNSFIFNNKTFASSLPGLDSFVIHINNTASTSTLTNYQLSFIVDTSDLISQGLMRSDCGDIRFLDSDNSTPINNYWVENCNSTATKIWIKIPSIPASSYKNIYMYYNNPNLTSLSSIS